MSEFQTELERARLRLQRHVASVLVNAMAETGATFETMAAKFDDDTTAGDMRLTIHELIEGIGGGTDLSSIADLALSIGGRLEIFLERVDCAPPLDLTGER